MRSVIVVPDAAGAGPSDPRAVKNEPNMQNSAEVQNEVHFAADTDYDDMVDAENNEIPEYPDEDGEEDMILDDDASDIHNGALGKYVPDDEVFSDSFITDQ